MAEASLTQAIEQYGLLGGVGPVPGFVTKATCPCWDEDELDAM